MHMLDDVWYTIIEKDEGINVKIDETSLIVRSKKVGEYKIKLRDSLDNEFVFVFKISDLETGIDKIE